MTEGRATASTSVQFSDARLEGNLHISKQEFATSEEAATTEQPVAEPTPIARVIYSREHEKLVPLEWPVEFDGKLWTEIRVHRVSGKEVGAYFEALRTSEANILPPMIECPIEVWHALDADDQHAVDLAAMDFTPKRLKAIFNAAVTLDAAAPTATLGTAS